MANFAQIENGVVSRIVVISNDDIKDEIGVEQETLGIALCNQLVGQANWVQTSFNNNFRKQYGQVGFTYDKEADVFVSPSPFPSWVLDDQFDWQAPVARPQDDNVYAWDESSCSWVRLNTSDKPNDEPGFYWSFNTTTFEWDKVQALQ